MLYPYKWIVYVILNQNQLAIPLQQFSTEMCHFKNGLQVALDFVLEDVMIRRQSYVNFLT